MVGIDKGDVIISFDGENLETMEELSNLLDCTQKGSKVWIDIMEVTPEGYQEQSLQVILQGRD